MEQTTAGDLLFVSPIREDQAALRRIAGVHATIPAASCRQAFRCLGRDRFEVVFCESDLPDGSWLEVLDRIADLYDPPPLIVTSRLADGHLWSKVLNLGGFDVLSTPFREPEVRHALQSARAHRTGPARVGRRAAGA